MVRRSSAIWQHLLAEPQYCVLTHACLCVCSQASIRGRIMERMVRRSSAIWQHLLAEPAAEPKQRHTDTDQWLEPVRAG